MTSAPSRDVSVYLPVDVLETLEQEALYLGVSRSALIRELCEEAMAARIRQRSFRARARR